MPENASVLWFGFLGAALLFLAAGCESQAGDGPLCLYDCDLCSSEGCPPDRCGLLVVMSEHCEGYADFAEVAVGECLEESSVRPGEQLLLCATVLKGKSAVIHVKADEPESWVWQHTEECSDEEAGALKVVTLKCESSESAVEDPEEERN